MFTNSSVAIIMAFGIIFGSGSAEISREEINDMSKKNVTVASTMANSKNTDEVEGVCYATETIGVEDYPYFISAQEACKIALTYSDRVFKEQVEEVYNKIHTAATDGRFTIRIYSDEISNSDSLDLKKMESVLKERGYHVSISRNNKPYENDEWVLIIDWSECYEEVYSGFAKEDN